MCRSLSDRSSILRRSARSGSRRCASLCAGVAHFTNADNATAPLVVVVNETFARQYWPGQSAVGKKIVIGRRPEPALVVGVAADVKNQGLEKKSQAQLYLPFPQLSWSDMNLLVRTDVPTGTVQSQPCVPRSLPSTAISL